LHLMTIKGYLVTDSSVNNPPSTSDLFVLGSVHPFRSLTPNNWATHSYEGPLLWL
jgi:hypothetical protein